MDRFGTVSVQIEYFSVWFRLLERCIHFCRQREARKAQGESGRRMRPRERAPRAMPAPEANAENQSNIDVRIQQQKVGSFWNIIGLVFSPSLNLFPVFLFENRGCVWSHMRMPRARVRSFLHRIKTGRLVFKWDHHGDWIHRRYRIARAHSLRLTRKSHFRLGQALWLPLELLTQPHGGGTILTRREEWHLRLKAKESLFEIIIIIHLQISKASFLIEILWENSNFSFFLVGYMFSIWLFCVLYKRIDKNTEMREIITFYIIFVILLYLSCISFS